MNKLDSNRLAWWGPRVLAVGMAAAILIWLNRGPNRTLTLRVPGTDQPPGTDLTALTNAVLAGKLVPGNGQAADLPGAWPGFRGPNRDGISADTQPLGRAWEAAGPRALWSQELGEGYAAPAVLRGRVYLMDYDRAKKQDALRCLSLADGKEIWRYAYPVSIKRNHGMTRTVPAVTDQWVVAIGPKCHVVCLDAQSGQLRWGLDLVHQFGATVPPWYAGQCPLIEDGKVILAPGGPDALLVALEVATGKVLWQTPNPRGWKMTHSSIMPMEFGGRRMYVYCASQGVVGVAASDGASLWETQDWKISLATVPSPVPLGDGAIFLCGGYNAGSLKLQLKTARSKIEAQPVFRLPAETFGATQQTPVLYRGYLYGVRADGRFVCLDLQGKVVWASPPTQQFGLGSFLLAGGLIYALNDSGKLSLLQATPSQFNLLAQAQVLNGRESWAPPTLAGSRLLVRDSTRLVCLEVGN